MPRRVVAIAGALLSVGLVLFLAHKFDWGEVLRSIRDAHWRWVLLGTVLYLLLFAARGLRWSLLLRSVAKVSVSSATDAFIVGSMANNLLPARLGDIARALLLARREGVSRGAAFTSVMLERVFDGVTVVVFLSLVLWLDPPDAPWIAAIGGSMSVLFLGAIAGALLVAHFERHVLAILDRWLRLLPLGLGERAIDLIARLARGLGVLRNAKDTLAVSALSLFIWTSEVVVYAVVQKAFGLSLPWSGLTLVMCVLTLGLTVPSSPGFVGVYEGLVIATVTVYGAAHLAPAFGVTMHIVHYVPTTLLGLGLLWRGGLRLRDLREASPAPGGEDPPPRPDIAEA